MNTKLFQKLALVIALFVSRFVMASGVDPYLTLSSPILTNGQVQFSLLGEREIPCVIESSPDMVNWTPVSTNIDFSVSRVVTLDAPDGAQFYRAGYALFPVFSYALAASGNIILNGTGLVTDSFNSANPNLSTNGQYDSTKATNHGDIAVAGALYINSHTANGDVFLGPYASFVGSTNQISGTFHSDRVLYFPDVQLPSAIPVPAPVINSTNLLTVSGYYSVSNLFPIDVAAGITVQVLTTNANLTSILIHGGATNSGTAYIYLAGTSAIVSGNTAIDSSYRARNLVYYGLPSLTSIYIYVSDFYGVIYAPSAALAVNASDARNLYGSCIVQDTSIDRPYTFHFDEDLINLGQSP